MLGRTTFWTETNDRLFRFSTDLPEVPAGLTALVRLLARQAACETLADADRAETSDPVPCEPEEAYEVIPAPPPRRTGLGVPDPQRHSVQRRRR